jgi:hypothetical protein
MAVAGPESHVATPDPITKARRIHLGRIALVTGASESASGKSAECKLDEMC